MDCARAMIPENDPSRNPIWKISTLQAQRIFLTATRITIRTRDTIDRRLITFCWRSTPLWRFSMFPSPMVMEGELKKMRAEMMAENRITMIIGARFLWYQFLLLTNVSTGGASRKSSLSSALLWFSLSLMMVSAPCTSLGSILDQYIQRWTALSMHHELSVRYQPMR